MGYRKALVMRPDYAAGHGNLLFALNYRTDGQQGKQSLPMHLRAWDRRRARHLAPMTPNYTLDQTPGWWRLRVGVRLGRLPPAHSCNVRGTTCRRPRQIESGNSTFIQARRRRRTLPPNDFVSLSDHWQNTIGLTDAQLAEQTGAVTDQD